MGAEYQEITIEASDPAFVESKFNAFVEECRYDYGHSGYTGTFAEKDGVDIIDKLHTEETARAVLEDNDKWENAQAIRIGIDKWLVGGWCSS